MVKFTQEFQRCRKMPPSTFQHTGSFISSIVWWWMMDPKLSPKNLVWTPKIEQGIFSWYIFSHSFGHILSDFSMFQSSLLFSIFWLQKIRKKLSKTVIKPSLGIWDIPYTALSGATYILGNQCIASLGSSSTVSFISSNVWNTRTNKAFKKWQRKFYYNVCV